MNLSVSTPLDGLERTKGLEGSIFEASVLIVWA
jgi:hypothetical protein